MNSFFAIAAGVGLIITLVFTTLYDMESVNEKIRTYKEFMCYALTICVAATLLCALSWAYANKSKANQPQSNIAVLEATNTPSVNTNK